MELVLHMVVVAASVIGAGMALPQARRLVVTRNAAGVSPTWIGVSIAINLWWTAYAFAASVWVLLPVSIASLVLYASMGVAYMRIVAADGTPQTTAALRSMAVGAFGLGLAPLPALILGGWSVAGVAIGLCYGLQLLPAVVAVCRSDELGGVSPGTWILSFIEGVLWLVYGAAILDGALIAGGVAGVTMAGLILARLVVTGQRPFALRSTYRPAMAA